VISKKRISDPIGTASPGHISRNVDNDFHTSKTAVISSAHAIHDTYAGFFAPLLPYLIERLSLLKAEAGLFLLFYQGASILQPLIGHLGDQKNLRKYALLMPAVTGISLSLLGTAPTFFIALIYCLIAGISSASLHAVLPALVSSLSGNRIGKGMSFWMVGGEIGVMIGPLLVTAVAATFSIRATPWLMIPGILMAVLLSFILKDLPFHNLNKNNHIKAPIREMVAILLPLAGVILMRSLLRTASEIYLPLYLMENGADPWLAGSAVSLLLGFGVVGMIAGGYLNDRFGFQLVTCISIIIASIGMIAFTLSDGFLQLINLAVLGLFSMMMIPVGLALVQERFPNNRSLANGLYLALLFAINAVSGVFTGFLYDQIGGFYTFFWSGFIGLLSIPFVFLIPKEKPAQN